MTRMEEKIEMPDSVSAAGHGGEMKPQSRNATAVMKASAWQAEIDQAGPAQWAAMLDLFEDACFYQTWQYGEVRWGRQQLSHLVLRRDGEPAAMAQLRIYRPAKLPFGIAYLRWGPLFHRKGQAMEAAVARHMAEALRSEYAVRRGLFLRILPNAFAGSSRAESFQAAFSEFTSERQDSSSAYRTLVLDLEPSLEDLRRALDKKWRNQLSQAERKNLSVVESSGPDAFQKFLPMYAQMRSRKDFETTVDVEEFRRMQDRLPASQRMRVLLCEEAGEPVAGIVVSAMGDSGVFLLGATSDQGLSSRGSYLLHWTFIRWLKSNGFRYYDLGGINPEENPGVYHFKKGLSGADRSHLPPCVFCTRSLSAVAVRAGESAQSFLQAWRKGLKAGRS